MDWRWNTNQKHTYIQLVHLSILCCSQTRSIRAGPLLLRIPRPKMFRTRCMRAKNLPRPKDPRRKAALHSTPRLLHFLSSYTNIPRLHIPDTQHGLTVVCDTETTTKLYLHSVSTGRKAITRAPNLSNRRGTRNLKPVTPSPTPSLSTTTRS